MRYGTCGGIGLDFCEGDLWALVITYDGTMLTKSGFDSPLSIAIW